MNQVAFDPRNRPRASNGRAALGDHADQFDRAADRYRHAARLEYVAVQIHLRDLIAGTAAGQPAQDRPGRVGLVPAAQPALRIQMKRLGKDQPAVGPVRAEAGFGVPVGGALGFLDLFLREVKRLEFGGGQREQTDRHTGRIFQFTTSDDDTGAGAACQQGDVSVDAKNLQHLRRVREECRGEEDQAEGDARRAQPAPQLFGPGLKPGFFKSAIPMPGDGELVVHGKKLAGSGPMANPKRRPVAMERGRLTFDGWA